MLVIVFVLLMIAVVLFADFSRRDDNERMMDEARALATQMAAYHTAAKRYCGAGSCAAGVLPTPTAYLPGAIANGAAYGTVRFRTYSDGAQIVTTYVAPGDGAFRMWGPISANLGEITSNSLTSGRYDRATNRVISMAGINQTLTTPKYVTVTPGIGGADLQTGMPVMVSKL